MSMRLDQQNILTVKTNTIFRASNQGSCCQSRTLKIDNHDTMMGIQKRENNNIVDHGKQGICGKGVGAIVTHDGMTAFKLQIQIRALLTIAQ